MVAVVIPAFEPPPTLRALTAALLADRRVAALIIVDDGSSERAQWIFRAIADQPRTTVLRHSRNRGKGAALKSAFKHVLEHLTHVTTVVTADADGQHLPDDIQRVAGIALASPAALVLGVREVGGTAPARSRLGNCLTRKLYRALVGQHLRDTQSGLRAFSSALLSGLISLDGRGYEYELNMLIWCRQSHIPIVQEPIEAVYFGANRDSHFRPIRDSWRVYAVLLRFGAVSLASAMIDILIFVVGLAAGAPELGALALARLSSAGFNYPLVRRWVFPQPDRRFPTLIPYLTLLGLNVMAARVLMTGLHDVGGLSAPLAKVVCESLFFLPNFLLQRDVIFRSAALGPGSTTDRTSHSASIPIVARLLKR